MAKITIEYCSKYKSYNGEKVTEGKVLAPVMISDEEFKSNNTIIPENLKTWKHYGVPFRVGFMVVDEADFDKMLSLYYGCINDYFDEHPELRPGRCVLGWDSEGFPILCGKGTAARIVPDAQNIFRVTKAVKTSSHLYRSRTLTKMKMVIWSESKLLIPVLHLRKK